MTTKTKKQLQEENEKLIFEKNGLKEVLYQIATFGIAENGDKDYYLGILKFMRELAKDILNELS